MASSSSAKHLLPLLLLLLSLLSSLHFSHARDSQFFNKVPTNTNNNVLSHEEQQPLNNQQQQEPDFLPENDNGYGLESSNLPPSSTATTFPDDVESKQPLNKYRPKNYNPVAYVTEPEDVGDSPTLTKYENSNNYPNTQQEDEAEEYRSYPTTTTANNRNKYNNFYGGGSSFNSDPQGTIDARFMGGAGSEKYFNFHSGGETSRYLPQGMSDTRSLENGKYFYDVNSEKYSSSHPYTRMSGVRARNEYSDSESTFGFNGENSIGGYQNQDDFQDEEDNVQP